MAVACSASGAQAAPASKLWLCEGLALSPVPRMISDRTKIRTPASFAQPALNGICPPWRCELGAFPLSQYSPSERHNLFRKLTFERSTPKSPTSIADVEAALKMGESRGYYLSVGEFVEDLIAIAAPLPLKGRTLAIVVAGPMSRCYEKADTIGQFMRDSAAKCVAELNRK